MSAIVSLSYQLALSSWRVLSYSLPLYFGQMFIQDFSKSKSFMRKKYFFHLIFYLKASVSIGKIVESYC